jgi:hypothetical protein
MRHVARERDEIAWSGRKMRRDNLRKPGGPTRAGVGDPLSQPRDWGSNPRTGTTSKFKVESGKVERKSQVPCTGLACARPELGGLHHRGCRDGQVAGRRVQRVEARNGPAQVQVEQLAAKL